MNQEPDYTKYSLYDLHDAYAHINKETYPERSLILEKEISIREQEPKPEPREITSKIIAWRRTSAFFIDAFIIWSLWSILDNLIIIPVPRWFGTVSLSFIFCAYFILSEGMGRIRASPGMRFEGLTLTSFKGSDPTLKSVVIRTMVLASMLTLDWADLISFMTIPAYVATMLGIVPAGVVLYNSAVMIYTPERLMIQDRITSTYIKSGDEREGSGRFVPESGRVIPRPYLLLVSVLLVSSLGLGIGAAIDGGRYWTWPTTSVHSITELIEGSIADEFGLRSEVEVTEVRTWHGGSIIESGEAEKRLELEIWVPMLQWSKATREQLKDHIKEILLIERSRYTEGKLKIGTGYVFLWVWHTYELWGHD